jgi:glycosyltransferase involved in cell wall biosynthesis
MRVSVAICTWNRSAVLDRTLARMCELRVPDGVQLEVLVVNNNCTDVTDEVTARHAHHLPIRRLFEPSQGIAFARNCAASAASGELLLFADDDCLVDPNWLEEYVAAARQWPGAVIFGGTIDPCFEVEPPLWINANLDILTEVFGILQRGPAVRPLTETESVFSGNMAIRTEVLRKNLFDTRLGRVCRQRVGGEEIDLFVRLMRGGYRGIWVGTARVRHYVPCEHLTMKYVWESYRGVGRTAVLMEGVGESKRLWGLPRWALRRYWEASVRRWCLRPFRGRGWVRALKDAAMSKGLLEQVSAELAAGRCG